MIPKVEIDFIAQTTFPREFLVSRYSISIGELNLTPPLFRQGLND